MDPSGEEDRLVWTSATDGKFSIKSTWNLINTSIRVVCQRKWIWSILLPSKMFLFLWRISWNAVTVDANVQSRMVSLASKCSCCSESQVETMDHLLLHGDLGRQVWCYFATILKVGLQNDISSTILFWHELARGSSYTHSILGVLLRFIC